MFDFEGISMTHFFTENWEKVRNFQSRPDDILIATYPKAGETINTIKQVHVFSFQTDL